MEVELFWNRWLCYVKMLADNNLHTDGQSYVQCGIAKKAKSSNEVALVHSSLTAVAINGFIASLELKGVCLLVFLLFLHKSYCSFTLFYWSVYVVNSV